MFWLESQDLAEEVDGFLNSPLIRSDQSQVEIGIAEIGLKLSGSGKVSSRFIEIPIVLEYLSQVVLCTVRTGSQLEGAAVIVDCLL